MSPLPEPEAMFYVNDNGRWQEGRAGSDLTAMFTAEQMHSYAAQEVAAERERMNQHAVTLAETARVVEQERCAKLCERLPVGTGLQGKTFAEAMRGEGFGGQLAQGFKF